MTLPTHNTTADAGVPFKFGPWRDGNEAIHTQIDRANPWSGTVFRVSEMSDARALVCMTFGASPEECAALATLIAAAPDLLEACANWIDWLKPDAPWREDAADYEAAMLDAMRAAIAKATNK